LLKQLTDLGYAIGSLAALDMPRLKRVAATHAQALSATEDRKRREPDHTPPMPAWRLALVGAALHSRLQRPALLRRLGRPVVLLGPFDNIAQATAALQGAEIDTLLMHEPQLHGGWLADLKVAAPALAGVPKAVLFRFAADPVCEALATAGTALLREPQPDAAVSQRLDSLATQAAEAPQSAAGLPAPTAHTATHTAPPRRWDDAALAAFTSLSPTIACECPQHVAELLMQLSHFEAYSAACENRNVADAQLHAYLRQVATAARTRFEAVLEQVALHEGLLLPTSASALDPAGCRLRGPAGLSHLSHLSVDNL
jgi:hypothetical protein